MQQRVLILGIDTAFGQSAAEAFWNAGWYVTIFAEDGTGPLGEALAQHDVVAVADERWAFAAKQAGCPRIVAPPNIAKTISGGSANGRVIACNVIDFHTQSRRIVIPDKLRAAINEFMGNGGAGWSTPECLSGWT